MMGGARSRAPLWLAALLLASGCAPQRPPGAPPGPPASVPESASRTERPPPPLFEVLQALSERAEGQEFTEVGGKALLAEMDEALAQYLEAPPEVRGEPQVQGALERMCDAALQLALDANAAPEGAGEPAETLPLDSILKQTTFLAPEELGRVFEEVQSALKAKPMDLPVEVNDAVLGYVNLYQTKLRDWFSGALTRGAPYMPTMRRIFQEEGVPTSLVYLSIVESACNPKAYSRARAAGMWQFIPGTAKRYGLAVDFWEDERFDPERSARASAKYLKDLHAAFGDWNLAMAAYNTGEGRILRRLSKNPGEDFWDMRDSRALVRETREYVPAILASIILASNPKAYGFEVPEEGGLEPTAEVLIPTATDLRVLAQCAGVPVEALQALNPSLRRLMTPPREYALRIPAQAGETFAAALAAVPEDQRTAVKMHTVKKGESLKGIGRKYGVPSEAIRLANLLPSRRIKAGQTLVIPMGTASSDPSLFVESSPRKKSRSAGSVYRVRKGDTLSSIARRTGVPIATLKDLNGLGDGSLLRPGQRLVLAQGSVKAGPSRGSAQRGEGASRARGDKVHHVKKGDTLYVIARRYGVTVDQLCRANRISKGKTLHPGDTLLIP